MPPARHIYIVVRAGVMFSVSENRRGGACVRTRTEMRVRHVGDTSDTTPKTTIKFFKYSYNGDSTWAGGEIGRRTWLRTKPRKGWRFESSPAHKKRARGARFAFYRVICGPSGKSTSKVFVSISRIPKTETIIKNPTRPQIMCWRPF